MINIVARFYSKYTDNNGVVYDCFVIPGSNDTFRIKDDFVDTDLEIGCSYLIKVASKPYNGSSFLTYKVRCKIA